MNDIVSTFPLCRLPKKAMLNTLRIMNLLEIFGLSILSKKCKNLVESLKLTPMLFRITVSDYLIVSLGITEYSMLRFYLYLVWENQPIQELGTPANVHSFHYRKRVTWTNSMSVKQLIDHIRFIFHSSGVSLFFQAKCERFSLESIHENVRHIESICLETENQEQNRRILSLFRPASLTLKEQALVNFRIPRDILVQNFDVIDVKNNMQISLDDLLLTNVRYINLHCRILSRKTLNKFLKLWIKGVNPRLDCLILEFPGNLPFEELFNGLKYQTAPIGVRPFKTAGVRNLMEIFDGEDIWRFDGTKATISFEEEDGIVNFRFYVWHDHCIVI